MEGVHEKNKSKFEIQTFYHYIDLYRACFHETLTVQENSYRT